MTRLRLSPTGRRVLESEVITTGLHSLCTGDLTPWSTMLVNEVAAAAEAAGHHPDIDIRWNRVTLALSSHAEGGLTDRDFQLAARIQEFDQQRSPPN